MDRLKRGGKRTGNNSGPNDATEYYVSGEGMWINQYLRGRGDFGTLSDEEKEYLKDLDAATKGSVKEKVLYRSVDASALFGDIDATQYESLLAYVIHGMRDKLYAKEAESMINGLIGRTITEKGFLSTTKDFNIAADFGDFTGASMPIVLKINTSKSTRGVDVSIYDKNVDPDQAQREVLLARDQSYVPKRVYTQENVIVVEVNMR